jgi:HAD superfamily hydrolase (TIGR01509 family)
LKRLRGVIFDYGNTLIRLDPSVRSQRTDYADVVARPGAERLQRFLTSSGLLSGRVPGESEFVERFLDVRERNRMIAEDECREISAVRSLEETLRGLGLALPGAPVLERAIEEVFAPEVELIRPVPGVMETLNTLRSRGVMLSVLSNATSGSYVARVIDRMGWRGYFDPLVVSADIGVRKPRPEAFRAVLDLWPLAPGEIAMVGDSLYHDVKGAQALGLVAVHFTAIANHFDAPHVDSVRPAFAVSTHEELLRVLLRALA